MVTVGHPLRRYEAAMCARNYSCASPSLTERLSSPEVAGPGMTSATWGPRVRTPAAAALPRCRHRCAARLPRASSAKVPGVSRGPYARLDCLPHCVYRRRPPRRLDPFPDWELSSSASTSIYHYGSSEERSVCILSEHHWRIRLCRDFALHVRAFMGVCIDTPPTNGRTGLGRHVPLCAGPVGVPRGC